MPRRKNAPPNKKFHVYLTPDLHRQLEEIAKKNERSISFVIRQLCQAKLKEFREQEAR